MERTHLSRPDHLVADAPRRAQRAPTRAGEGGIQSSHTNGRSYSSEKRERRSPDHIYGLTIASQDRIFIRQQ